MTYLLFTLTLRFSVAVEHEKHDLLGITGRLKEDSAQRDGVSFFFIVHKPNKHH